MDDILYPAFLQYACARKAQEKEQVNEEDNGEEKNFIQRLFS